jgi:2-polyprenyl-3-methyl-5-hydroxy-6-metoxy-1,4-benzoquinol methylase
MFRLTHVPFEKTFDVYISSDTLDMNEWENTSRLSCDGWMNRYEYESNLIKEIISENNLKTILEIGSGPGILSQLIQKNIDVNYHLIDKPFAEKYFRENKLKGTFFVKDISMDLNTEGLSKKYDLIICNDVLEHLLAPTNIVRKIHDLMTDDSLSVISIPNWRMGHQFIYRGLWDYDNILYFMYVHGLTVESVYPSPLKTPFYKKLDTESCMPEELLNSWNFYLVVKRRKI